MNLELLAADISKVYMQNPKVDAVLLGGSVARGWNDEFSDIELFVFWKESPSDEDRTIPIHALNGTIIDFHPFEEEEWSETYVTQGIKLEISNFLTVTIQKVIESVMLEYDPDLDKQCLVASVHDGVSLCGEHVIELLKEQVKNYPRGLSEAMIRENMDLGNRWNNREALLHREDWLMLYQVMASVQTKLMAMLFGLNRKYIHHPAFKWQKQSLAAMSIVPQNFSERFESILLKHPKEGLRELEALTLEIYELIQREFPSINLNIALKKLAFLRPKHNEG